MCARAEPATAPIKDIACWNVLSGKYLAEFRLFRQKSRWQTRIQGNRGAPTGVKGNIFIQVSFPFQRRFKKLPMMSHQQQLLKTAIFLNILKSKSSSLMVQLCKMRLETRKKALRSNCTEVVKNSTVC